VRLPDRLEVVTDGTFAEQVEASTEPYLVEFASPMCAPCAALEPVLVEVAQHHDGKLRIGKIDITQNPATTERFGVLTTPTMILFKAREPVRRLMGAKNTRNLLEALSDYVDRP
jgi:thioredoxin 1